MRLTITTANICGNPLRPKWAVRKRMRLALAQPDVVFGQEVARSNRWQGDNYSAMWSRVASVASKVTFGGPHEVPISVPKGWDVLSTATHLVHTGRKRVSPNRYITEVRCQVGDQQVAFLNCHPVSKPRRGVPAASWRISRWDEYHTRLAALVAELHGAGFTVIFGGDMNKVAVAVVHPAQQVLTARGLDHLWAVAAAGTTVTVIQRRAISRTVLMDHPILSATIEIGGPR
jgi:hypothetical protein